MLPEKLRKNDAGTVGLPIRIVVLSIVGLAGFYAILSALGSAPAPAEPLYATANISSFSLPSPESARSEETNLSLLVKVFDRDSRGVGEANVILRSPDRQRAYSGITDSKGNVVVKISNPELPPGKAEGYVSIRVMRTGYIDFTSDYFVKVTSS
jgi:hypothetical protein